MKERGAKTEEFIVNWMKNREERVYGKWFVKNIKNKSFLLCLESGDIHIMAVSFPNSHVLYSSSVDSCYRNIISNTVTSSGTSCSPFTFRALESVYKEDVTEINVLDVSGYRSLVKLGDNKYVYDEPIGWEPSSVGDYRSGRASKEFNTWNMHKIVAYPTKADRIADCRKLAVPSHKDDDIFLSEREVLVADDSVRPISELHSFILNDLKNAPEPLAYGLLKPRLRYRQVISEKREGLYETVWKYARARTIADVYYGSQNYFLGFLQSTDNIKNCVNFKIKLEGVSPRGDVLFYSVEKNRRYRLEAAPGFIKAWDVDMGESKLHILKKDSAKIEESPYNKGFFLITGQV